MDELCAQWNSHRYITSPPSINTTTMGIHALEVSKPATINGIRNVTLIKNFFFGFEQYFETLGVIDDYSHINNALTYLWEST